MLRTTTPTTFTTTKNKKTVTARVSNEEEIVLRNNSVFSCPRIVAKAEANSSANVLVFIPPPVELYDAPINMSMMKMNVVGRLIMP